MTHHRLLVGTLLIVAAEVMFACMGATIRHVSSDLPNGMLVFAPNLVGLFLLSSIVAHPGRLSVRTCVPHLHLIRSVVGLGAMYCFCYAIAHAAGRRRVAQTLRNRTGGRAAVAGAR